MIFIYVSADISGYTYTTILRGCNLLKIFSLFGGKMNEINHDVNIKYFFSCKHAHKIRAGIGADAVLGHPGHKGGDGLRLVHRQVLLGPYPVDASFSSWLGS